MRRCLVRDPGSNEVRIADGLNLVHGVLVDEEVEERIEVVQEHHDLDLAESDKVVNDLDTCESPNRIPELV